MPRHKGKKKAAEHASDLIPHLMEQAGKTKKPRAKASILTQVLGHFHRIYQQADAALTNDADFFYNWGIAHLEMAESAVAVVEEGDNSALKSSVTHIWASVDQNQRALKCTPNPHAEHAYTLGLTLSRIVELGRNREGNFMMDHEKIEALNLAVEALKLACNLDPIDPDAKKALGDVFVEMSVILSEPQKNEAMNAGAVCYNEAVNLFQQASSGGIATSLNRREIEDGINDTRINMARLLPYNEAIQLLELVRQQKPFDVALRWTLGDHYRENGDVINAYQAYAEGLSLAPRDVNAMIGMADLYVMVGKNAGVGSDACRMCLIRALDLFNLIVSEPIDTVVLYNIACAASLYLAPNIPGVPASLPIPTTPLAPAFDVAQAEPLCRHCIAEYIKRGGVVPGDDPDLRFVNFM